ncbi:hypothetical protein A6A19_08640 [Actinobacillus delphinicola]|uniref:hypothetical protein n=1 Tax=Actinobacillus delphinicola TaxID=51161 RepID=UPI0024415445|nr:hypothetical protein [Actinobacillus delphinicola]MDG6898042.1 hypothetical protein [Actinobacillus delphinicola]
MNYRVLFVFSILIFGVGITGLIMMPHEEERVQPVQQPQSTLPKIPLEHIVVQVARANRNLAAGHLINQMDYDVVTKYYDVPANEANPQDFPILNFDLTPLLNQHKDITGWFLQHNISKGSLINPNDLINPNNENFIRYNINPVTQVAFSVPVMLRDKYLLSNLRAGDYVNIYAELNGDHYEALAGHIVKLIDHALILKINPYLSNRQIDGDHNPDDNYMDIAEVLVRLQKSQLERIYTSPHGTRLLILPSTKPEGVDSRGIMIRELQG